MDARLKNLVRRRAGFRCEYCHLPEAVAELPFQFDHIIAQQHGGLATSATRCLERTFCLERCEFNCANGDWPDYHRSASHQSSRRGEPTSRSLEGRNVDVTPTRSPSLSSPLLRLKNPRS